MGYALTKADEGRTIQSETHGATTVTPPPAAWETFPNGTIFEATDLHTGITTTTVVMRPPEDD